MHISHACMDVHVCTQMHTCMGITPTPPTPTKNLKAHILLEAEIWYIMSLDAKTLYVSNAKSMQTHKYVYITHDMPTHKFECPGKKFNPGQRQLQRIGTNLCEYAILYEHI